MKFSEVLGGVLDALGGESRQMSGEESEEESGRKLGKNLGK